MTILCHFHIHDCLLLKFLDQGTEAAYKAVDCGVPIGKELGIYPTRTIDGSL
jgi:hypothetical protein